MDNANGKSQDSHHNLLLVKFWFWKVFGSFFMIKPLSWSFTIVIKAPFLILSLFDQEIDHLNFTEFMWNTLIEFVHLANFLVQLVFSGWRSSTTLTFKTHILTVEFQKPAFYCPITNRFFTPCSINFWQQFKKHYEQA